MYYGLPAGGSIPEWPYPVHYGEESKISADLLVFGGSIAGCQAAINAAKRGAKAVVLEKGAVTM